MRQGSGPDSWILLERLALTCASAAQDDSYGLRVSAVQRER